MDYGLNGKNAVVLASTEGLGKTVATVLLKEGCNIAVCSREQSKIEKTVNELKSLNPKVMVVGKATDLTNSLSIDNFFNYVHTYFKSVDILVTNIGGPPTGIFESFDDASWYQAFDSIFMSVVRSIRHVLPDMKKNNSGRIVAITSLTAKAPQKNMILSNAIRAGLTGLIKTLSNEFASYNITVNAACPGYTATNRILDLAQQIAVKDNKTTTEVITTWEQNIPLKRMATPEEFASLVCYLCSKQAASITGASMLVDGGAYPGVI